MRTGLLFVVLSGITLVAHAGCALDAKGLATEVRRADTAQVEDDAAMSEEDADVGDDALVVEDAAPDTEVPDVEPEAPPPVLPGCSTATYASHDYLFCERPGNWDQARVSCQFAAMQLVKVGDEAEHDFLLKTLETKSKDEFHIGLWDLAKEGDFVWLDGTKPSFTSWAFLEPNDFFWREDCVSLDKGNGKWNDIECSAEKDGFICETP